MTFRSATCLDGMHQIEASCMFLLLTVLDREMWRQSRFNDGIPQDSRGQRAMWDGASQLDTSSVPDNRDEYAEETPPVNSRDRFVHTNRDVRDERCLAGIEL